MLSTQVTTLVSSKSPQKKKGKAKRAHVLVAAVERATAIFVERGELIAVENPDIKVTKENPLITKFTSKRLLVLIGKYRLRCWELLRRFVAQER